MHKSLELGLPPEHVNPDYTLQSKLHPSPGMLFPSSHCNLNLLPSPHIYSHN